MFVELFSDIKFVILLMAFYVLLVLILLSKNKQKSQGLRWLMYYDESKQSKTHWSGFLFIARWLRATFSSTEAEMQKKFLEAGIYNKQLALYYMPTKYFSLFVGGGIIYWLSQQQSWKPVNLMVIAAVWVVVVLIIPDAYLSSKAKSLRVKISNKLPYMIDLLAVCVQTGMTIEASMSYLSKEMMSFDKDLGHMLNKTNDRIQIIGIEQALVELHTRVPTNEMRSFVMTLNQSLQYGTSIYTVLTTLSSEIREVQMLGLEEKIGQLSAKMSVPLILFVMFPIVILIAAPGIMRMMNG
ncbi:type II secretion system F family protein [Marinomonas gallaica]|uniref:type II secretion system F family protein n=1 Tax=Marinomonas gallaica TaxID=1806667 RepID=UPI0008349A07|nr:type II secretion system F family protein [Marinomonas gallaica]